MKSNTSLYPSAPLNIREFSDLLNHRSTPITTEQTTIPIRCRTKASWDVARLDVAHEAEGMPWWLRRWRLALAAWCSWASRIQARV
ncbi:hypothetical protein ERO13_D05G130650v2 [Gossypium hirsutum]|nr:hypothetical protein ERO13_D05G130650v2 [Gossypium hirsutum]